MTYSTVNDTVRAAALEARQRIADKHRSRDAEVARLNSARVSHRADGGDEMRLKVEESLLMMRYEEQGYSWREARDMARRQMQARVGVSA